MKLQTCLCLLLLALPVITNAQDKIYTKTGDVINAKTLHVGVNRVSYLATDKKSGPTKIAIKDIDKIVYSSGKQEVFDGRGRLARKKLNYGSNIFSVIMPLNITNDNVQASTGIGLSYERTFTRKGMFSIVLPVLMSYSLQNFSAKYADLYFMPGIKCYPMGSKRKVSYGVGPSLFLAAGQYAVRTGTGYETAYGRIYYEPGQPYSISGITLNNSLQIAPTPHLSMALEMAVGMSYHNRNGGDNGIPSIFLLNYRIGYRF